MSRSVVRRGSCAHVWMAGLIVAALALSQRPTQAAIKLVPRPLSPQEIKDLGLTNTTQKAVGIANTGIGQPLYIEALITKGTVVSNVQWTLVSKPTGSAAALNTSPLPPSLAPHDPGDNVSFSVAGRTLLVPDVACNNANGDYTVSAKVFKPGGSETATKSFYGSTYLGNGPVQAGKNLCVLCHEEKMAPYGETNHSTAFTRKISGIGVTSFGENCYSCHVLGYDKTAGATNAGFDDVATALNWTPPTVLTNTNWTTMPQALKDKSNIQCESCHGPSDLHQRSLGNTNFNFIGISVSEGTCGQCHDSMKYHVKSYEWRQSVHGTPNIYRTGSCAPCHTTVGFVKAMDPDYAARPALGSYNEGITCAACHDPHEAGNPHQIRKMDDVKLGDPTLTTGPYAYPVAVITEGGKGKLCMNCHRVRNRASEYYVENTTTALTGSGLSPHEGPQADMLAGENMIEYGMQMPSSRHLSLVEDSCVQCHMQETPAGAAANKVGGHTFRIGWDGGTPTTEADDVYLTEACAGCHGEIEDFDFGGADYDRDGAVEGVQSEIHGLLDTLGAMLPKNASGDVTPFVTPATHTLAQRRALYNYLCVKYDGSYGVHNPKYAAALLQASIDDLRGGIDVDKDGLIDSWERAQFGDLTSQTGDGDADGDGLSNKEEYGVGTDPEDSDSDNDGQSDLVEVQGGSNPLDAASMVDPSSMTILSAVELGYLPAGTGTVVQFQAIDALNGGSWSNIGPTRVSTGAWQFQLESTKDSDSRFFRAIENK